MGTPPHLQRPRVKIHLLNALLEGGAAAGAKQLTRSLKKVDVDATLYYLSKLKTSASQCDSDPDEHFIEPAAWPTGSLAQRLAKNVSFRIERQRFKRMQKRKPAGFEIFSAPRGAAHTPWPPTNVQLTGQDVLHLHWVSKLIDYESFFAEVPKSLPIVWTLHDMNPLTGGCHFSAGCDRFTVGCGTCPQLSEEDSGKDDYSARAFQTKAAAINGLNLHVVAPSRWLIRQAQKSPLLRGAKSFHRIPYGLSDECHHAVVAREEARRVLGIDPNTFVFCFGAADVENQRKGARFLVDAMNHLASRTTKPILGLVFGGGQLPSTDVPVRELGYLRTAAERLQVFGASDVFVVPSTEDNLPITAMEAMAGGTAMLGFDVSGVPDLVIDGVTGRLANLGSGEDLGRKLCEMLDDPHATSIQGQKAREIASENYRAKIEARAYLTLYAALLENPNSADDLPTAL